MFSASSRPRHRLGAALAPATSMLIASPRTLNS
jgi:hypothetical protein